MARWWYNNPRVAMPTAPTSYFGRRPTLTRQLKAAIRKGIPFELRPKIWPAISGANFIRSQYPEGYYSSLTPSARARELPPLIQAQIESLARHSFPDPEVLRTAAGQDALRRVLLAYALHNPHAGYSSHLVHIAAYLLVVYSIQGEELGEHPASSRGSVEPRARSLAVARDDVDAVRIVSA